MTRILVAFALAALLSGCVAAPRPGDVPPGVVYVGPTYVSPGRGYEWHYHRGYGWGWWHPRYGWHRGWR